MTPLVGNLTQNHKERRLIMIATCIKTDPLQALVVGRDYEIEQINGKFFIPEINLALSEERFNEHFVKKSKTRDEEQDEALVKYLDECGETQDSDLCCGFIDGWDKADETMIDKACEWLKENIYHRVYECGDRLGFPTADFIKDFRKAMKGGES